LITSSWEAGSQTSILLASWFIDYPEGFGFIRPHAGERRFPGFPRWRGGALLGSRSAFEPFRLKPLPAVRHHRVGGGVRIDASGEFPGEKLGSAGREGLAETLAVLDNRCGVVRIENGFEFGAGGK
jgi:hypothetical protein